ncbi:MAG: hypothetical protein V4736_08860 [Bdellovibrionota bacterium]
MFNRKPKPKSIEAVVPKPEVNGENSLLIVKSKTESMKGIETFLSKRHWEISAAVEVKDIFNLLTKKKPKFVMIPVDHPNSKMQMLPKLIAQTFKCTVLYYAEFNTPNSNQQLQKLSQEFCLYPPASGPAVERMMLKVQKAQKAKDDLTNTKTFETDNSEPKEAAVINIRGSAKAKLIDPKIFDRAKSVLHKAVQTGPGSGKMIYMPNQTPIDKLLQDYSAATSAKKVESSNLSAANTNKVSDFIDEANISVWNEIEQAEKEAALKEAIVQAKAEAGMKSAAHTGAGIGPATKEQKPRVNLSKLGDKDFGSVKNTHSKLPKSGGMTDAKNPTSSIIQTGSESKMKAHSPERDSTNQGTNSFYKTGRARTPLLHKPGFEKPAGSDSVLIQGIQNALDESVTVITDTVEEQISTSSKVCCLSVNSGKHSGYLIAAYGRDRALDPDLMTLIRLRFVEFMNDQGETIVAGDNLHLTLKEVEFESWAMDQASFLRRSVHLGQEIAIAYFPFEQAAVEFGASATNEMMTLDLKNIEAGQVLDFDIFIHLAANKRFVRYAAKGVVFQALQKERLQEKGINKIHLMKTELKNVDSYRTKAFLNSQIDRFKKKIPELT